MSKAPRIDGIEEVTQDLQEVLGVTTEATLIPQYMIATNTTGTPAAGTFYSAISGRAPMLDLSKIPTGRQGIERIPLQDLRLLSTELSPAGTSVYTTAGGDDRIRLYGNNVVHFDETFRDFILLGGGSVDNAIEITFYGTGLNVLMAGQQATERGVNVDVDGVFDSFVSSSDSTNSLDNRGYANNHVLEAVSGLTLGIHTVTLTPTTFDAYISGVEIVNDSADVQIPEGSLTSGSKKIDVLFGTDDLATFANEYQDGGTLITDATKGGCMVRYTSDAGVVVKDINYVDSSTGTHGGSNVDHSNEEVVQNFHHRQFGAGRADDFSTLDTSPTSRSFTLDDGTTTLVGNAALEQQAGAVTHLNTVKIGALSGYLRFTFIGTGLDINLYSDPSQDEHELFVDGASIGTILDADISVKGTKILFPVVSGLPFGTHTVELRRNVFALGDISISDFIVYAPKKPTIPEDAVEIDSTYKMADYVAATTTNQISTGVIRKIFIREHTYNGGYSMNSDIDSVRIGGKDFRTSTPGSTASYTFFGTGFDIRFHQETAPNNTITVDGSSDLSGFTTTTFGGAALNPATGVLTNDAFVNVGVTVAGLSLGMHTVTVTNNAGTWIHGSTDIHVPTYSYSDSVLNMSDELVGSNTLKSEILVPGATKTKIVALDGIDTGEDYRENYLQSGVSATAGTYTSVTDLWFEDLEVGATYEYSLTYGGFVDASSAAFVLVNFGPGPKNTRISMFDLHTSGNGITRYPGSMTGRFVSHGYLKCYLGTSLGSTAHLSSSNNTNTVVIPGVSDGATDFFPMTWISVRKIKN